MPMSTWLSTFCRNRSGRTARRRLELLRLEERAVPTVAAVNETFTPPVNTPTTLDVRGQAAAASTEPVSLLSYGSVAPSGPTLTPNPDGTLTFTSASTGTYTFSYTATGAKQELTNSGATDQFGTSVAISGNTAVVGDPFTGGGSPGPGAAYIFTRSGTTWVRLEVLAAADGASGDFFGDSVAIDGNTIVVGAPDHAVNGNANQGAAYIFAPSGTAWVQQQELTATDGAGGDQFGTSVAVSGNTVVVGAPDHSAGGNAKQGTAYVFTSSGSTWSQQQELTGSDGTAGDLFGSAVALDGTTAIVGAPDHGASVGVYRAGAAYAFVRNGNAWTQQQEFTVAAGQQMTRFGTGVAVSGDTAVIGSPGLTNTGKIITDGNAYVFIRSAGSWTEQQQLTDGNYAYDSSQFGANVALSGNTLAVGFDVFQRSGTTWTMQQKIIPTGSEPTFFQDAAAASGTTLVVGLVGLGTGNAVDIEDTATASATVTVNVTPVVVKPIGTQTAADGSTLSLTVTAQSPDGGALTFGLGAGAPAGAAINAQTGAFTFTPTEANAQLPGTYTITVTATETTPTPGAFSQTFTVNVGPSSTYAGTGQAARQAVALGLTQSGEYDSNFIVAAYNRYLGRAPDAGGLAFWVSRMQQGVTDEQLEAGFIGSTEYIANHGGPGSGWIQGMYANLLGRTPAQSEVQYWLNQLNSGELPPQIALGFAASQERESQRVQADYQQYLDRGATTAEITYWVNVFLGGGTNEQVVAGFVSSQEYFQAHNGNVVDWLFAGYRAILNRQPDAPGFQSWLNQL